MRTTKVDSGAQVNNVGSTRIGASVYVGRFGRFRPGIPQPYPCVQKLTYVARQRRCQAEVRWHFYRLRLVHSAPLSVYRVRVYSC